MNASLLNAAFTLACFALLQDARGAEIGASQQESPVRAIQPEYPLEAKYLGIEGVVHVRVKIDEAGKVLDAECLSGPLWLRESALAAARQWVFRPALADGKPVKTDSELTFNFSLNEKGSAPERQPGASSAILEREPSNPDEARWRNDVRDSIRELPLSTHRFVRRMMEAVKQKIPSLLERKELVEQALQRRSVRAMSRLSISFNNSTAAPEIVPPPMLGNPVVFSDDPLGQVDLLIEKKLGKELDAAESELYDGLIAASRKLLTLLPEGESKRYSIALPDRKVTPLVRSKARYTEEALGKKLSGAVVLEVEYRADGRVGGISVKNAMRYG